MGKAPGRRRHGQGVGSRRSAMGKVPGRRSAVGKALEAALPPPSPAARLHAPPCRAPPRSALPPPHFP